MRTLATHLAYLAKATLFAWAILAFSPNANAQTAVANFAECSITGAGALSCIPWSGGQCSVSGSVTYCRRVAQGVNDAQCVRNSNGLAACSPITGNVACYGEAGISKCYTTTGNNLTVSPTTVSFSTQTVNVVSSIHNVIFTAGTVGYTINGFAITGDFQIATTTGACTTATPSSTCTVRVTATPRLPGARSGTLSIVTSVGTLPVPLTVTGNGLASPTGTDKDAGLQRTLRALTIQRWLSQLVLLWTQGAGNDIGGDIFPQGSLFAAHRVHMAAGNKVQTETDIDGKHAGPLAFTRTYNSAGFSSASFIQQDIGVGWRSNWDSLISLSSNGNTASIIRADGKSYTFTLSNGVWTTSSEVAAHLTRNNDGSGIPISWTLALPEGSVEQYDALGRLAGVTAKGGATYTLAYDSNGRLQTVTNGFGRQLSFAYHASGRLASATDPAGAATQYAYDGFGRLITVTYADNKTRQYVYESATWPFALTGIIDGTGTRYATFGYDANGRVSSSQFAGAVGGGTFSYQTGSTTFTDTLGTAFTKTFITKNGQALLATDAATCTNCPTTSVQYAYDANGFPTTITDKRGTQTTYTYNSRGLPLTIKEAFGLPEQRTTNNVWDPTYTRLTQTTKAGIVTNFQYDSQGNLTQVSSTSGGITRTTTSTYSGQGLLLQIDGPRTDVADVTAFAYDALGNMTSTTNPLGQVTQFSNFNGRGQPQQVNYPDGTIRTYTYDVRGRTLTDVYAGITTTYTYDANGNKASVATSDGASTTYQYDSAQRLIGITNNHGESTYYTLDALGRTTKTEIFDATPALATTVSTTYDGIGRVTKKTDANGQETRLTYDANNNTLTVKDPLNNTTTSTYDGLNRVKQVTDPLSHTVVSAYDPADVITAVTDPINGQTQYGYNGLKDNTSLTSPDTGASAYTYDSAGDLLTKLDARGKLASMTYDALGRTTQTSYSDGQAITMTYDTAAHGVGKLASMTDPSGTTTYTYDTNGRVATKTQTAQGIALQLIFTRDSLGRVTSLVYPSGKTLGVTYTGDRTSSLTWNGSPLLSGIEYFPFGSPESWLFGGTTEYTRTTDLVGRTSGYFLPTGLRSITFDNAGRITQISDSPTHNQTFTYDGDSQLLSFSGFTSASASETRAYTYDANGNRASATVNGVPSTYSYTTSTNKLAGVSGLYTNVYDAAGNLTSDGRLTYTFDARGRLIQIVTPGDSGNAYLWTYNGLGQPISRQDGADDQGHGYGVVWMYDDTGQMIGEYAYPGGAAQKEFIWLGDTLVGVAGNIPVSCQTPPCTSYGVGYVWTDHLGAPRAITNASGMQIWQWDSAPFGDTQPNSNPGGLGSFTINHRFPGQYFDVATSLIQNGARTYNPLIGRYIQSDPIGLGGGIGTYSYAGGNPVQKIDPRGNEDGGLSPVPLALIDPVFVSASRYYDDSFNYRLAINDIFKDLQSNEPQQQEKCWNGKQGNVQDLASGFLKRIGNDLTALGKIAASPQNPALLGENPNGFGSNSTNLGILGADLAPAAELFVPAGRAGYVADVSLIPGISDITAQSAVAMRNALKSAYRLGFFSNAGAVTYDGLVAAGKTDAQIITGAGRTNTGVNAAATASGAAAANSIANGGCQ